MKSARYPLLPPLNALIAFEAAARHEGFSQAAAELYVSASAVAHQIKQLESSLGVELFERHSHGVRLTLQGQEYLGPVQAHLLGLQRCSAQIRDTRHKPLRLATLHSVAQLWLQPRLKRYQARYHDHDFEITAASILDSPPPTADVVISFFAEPPPPRLWTRLWEEHLIPVCSPGHAFAPRRAVLYQDAHWNQDWPVWEREAMPQGSGLHFAGIRRASLYVLILQAALDGLGLMVGRASLLNDQLRHGELVTPAPLSPVFVPYGAYYLYRAPSAAGNLLAEQFCEWLMTDAETTDA
ncbi:MAG: LysR family transcriptional regulator [Thiothrix sp.]|nr:LysR family transcriptional regulator [Thiothrix sp.]HPQ95113.1 LysR family transcriptional regulator [Thiolinea sp.]